MYITQSQSNYGEPYTVIESSDDAARELIETYKEDGERLDARPFETAS